MFGSLAKKDVWVEQYIILGAVYMRPQSNQFTVDEVREHNSNFFDELARAAQVSSNVLLCGDFNAKIKNLCEVTDAHVSALVDCPALQHPMHMSALRKMPRGRGW